MCGIHAILTRSPSLHDLPPELRRGLVARGPDHFGQVERRVAGGADGDWSLRFTSTVLALRGDHVARQPLTADAGADARSGSVLCWNGEAWRVGGRRVEAGENDGELVFASLLAAAAESGEAVLDVLRGVEGPFAFVFYDAAAGTLFFGRDRLGRRSLLLAHARDGGMALCSITGGAGEEWREVEADGIYVVKPLDGAQPERRDWVVDEDAADFVSTLCQLWTCAAGRGRLSCQTYSTSCRFLAWESSTRRCPLPVVS